MQQERNNQQLENLAIDKDQMETTSKLEWVQPVLQKAPIAETASTGEGDFFDGSKDDAAS
jgi:hypothetical protein